ncbi:MAG: aminotransferase class V-fold PLP-dependent enzyme [Clostridiales bacterium]|nr:aminotransferase class V-fold PLP-dependent enzyme [Clostridiales bacterium]
MIYLDNAATTFPKPRKVVAEMTDCLTHYCANPGRSGHDMASKMASRIYETRETIADFFNMTDPLRIVFTANATESLNLAIKGLLKPGDHVVTTAMEHNSVLRPLKEMKGIRVTVVPADKNGCVFVRDIELAISPSTKLVVCTHSSNVTGSILPIKEIGSLCRKKRILFMADASQSAGAIPIDIQAQNIDILACPGHKSLFGPPGTGFLYLRPGIDVVPLKEGGTGTDSANLYQPRYFPEGYEAGTLNGPGIIGLREGIRFIEELGLKTIQQWEQHIIEILTDGIGNLPNIQIYGPDQPSKKTAIIAFNIKGMDCETAAYELNKRFGIAVRAGYHCAPLAHKAIGTYGTGAVRMSPGIFTTEEDIHKTLTALQKLSG